MKKLIAFVAIIVMIGCFSENNLNEKLIGKWQGIEWLISGKPSGRDYKSVIFEFESEGMYSAVFLSEKEEGKYRLKSNKLYTKVENELEKVVAIDFLALDTMIISMNRSGVSEKLVLVRVSE